MVQINILFLWQCFLPSCRRPIRSVTTPQTKHNNTAYSGGLPEKLQKKTNSVSGAIITSIFRFNENENQELEKVVYIQYKAIG